MQRLKRPFMIGALAFGFLFGACSSVSVHADYDPGTDFSEWHSYAWLPQDTTGLGDPRAGNQLVSERVTAAIENRLAEMGYERVANDGDFDIGFSISVRQAIDVRSDPTVYGRYGAYGRHGGYGVGISSGTTVHEYQEGTLQIDFVDPEGTRLLWRGTGTSRVTDGLSPEESRSRVNEVVQEILAQFPPE
ncbi:MAG: hypothetical protein ACI9F9_000878 [Candidatus Paceibacteria bacterium]|jgi:hypothetical protein